MTSPTQRTLAECRRRGWIAAITERWNPYAKVRVDLFGWIDVVALDIDKGRIIALQTTSHDNHADRADKVREKGKDWIRAGGIAYVWSWGKRGPRGKRKLWVLREEQITAEHEDLSTEHVPF